MTKAKIKHALIVGGAGMLAPMARAVASQAAHVSMIARHAARFTCDQDAANISGYDCDYGDRGALARVLDETVTRGAIDLAVLWIHSTAPEAPRQIAEFLSRAEQPVRFVHVLRSADGDPSRPERLANWREKVAGGLDRVRYAQVVLGFVAEANGSRWRSDQEISDGVLLAVEEDRPLTIVGAVSPWSSRP